MSTLIIIAVLVISGIVIERKYSPRLGFDSGVWFHYTAKRGARNKTKLF